MDESEEALVETPEESAGHSGNAALAIDIETELSSDRQKLIMALTWPSLAENLLTSLASMVDMMMVGTLGSYAISAVGLCLQPKFIMLASFMALGVGSTALVARFKGAREQANMDLVLNQTVTLTLLVTAALMAIMTFACGPLIRLIAGQNITGASVDEAIKYMDIHILGFPFFSLTFALNAVLRGVGNTRASFYNNTVANIVNVILNYCLIGGNLGFPRMEVAGASLATVIGQAVACAMAIFTVYSKKSGDLHFRSKMLLRVDLSMDKRILKIGLPAFIEQFIMRIGVIIFTMIVTSLGQMAYAAHMIVMNIHSLSFTIGMSFGTAVTTLVGQCLGRKRPDLAENYVSRTMILDYIVALCVSAFILLAGRFVVGLYTTEADILQTASRMLIIVAIANPLSNARFVYVSALRGAGDSRYPAFMSFIGVMLIRPIVSTLLCIAPFHIGLAGVWVAMVSDGITIYFLSRARFRAGKWKAIVV